MDEFLPKKKSILSNKELRLVAISLSILSLGLAIAYIGFFLKLL